MLSKSAIKYAVACVILEDKPKLALSWVTDKETHQRVAAWDYLRVVEFFGYGENLWPGEVSHDRSAKVTENNGLAFTRELHGTVGIVNVCGPITALFSMENLDSYRATVEGGQGGCKVLE